MRDPHEEFADLARSHVNRAIVLYRRAADLAPLSQRDVLLIEAARLEGFTLPPTVHSDEGDPREKAD